MTSLLFVIDKPQCLGGAHVATRLLIRTLHQEGRTVAVLCCDSPNPNVIAEYGGVRFHVFETRRFSFMWVLQGFYRRLFKHNAYPPWMTDPFGRIRRLMKNFSCVCCVSEESQFRRMLPHVSNCVRTVQLIHTNYHDWRRRMAVARQMAAVDESIYPKVSAIGVVGHSGISAFEELIPACKGKVFAFKNLIDCQNSRYVEKSAHDPIRLITLVDLDDVGAKDGPRILRIMKRLAQSGCSFVWDAYGCHPARVKALQAQLDQEGFGSCMHVHAYDPTIRQRLSEADLMLQISHYEGLPNSVYESMMCGTPVIATNVGCVSEQIEDGINGWLVDDDEEKIFNEVYKIICNKGMIENFNKALGDFKYDNRKILSEFVNNLLGRDCKALI